MGKNQYRTRDVAFWGALSALAVPALTLPGHALAADTATASTTHNGEQLDTVVVTAQRKQESAQKIGVAVTPLSGDELTKRGVTSINQLGSEVPSLEIQSPYGNGTPNFRIRGIGFSDYVDNVAPAVGVYVDEVAQPIVSMTQGALFDLERVEVLRGPQGTLYGRNTTGGAINFITKKPTDKFEGNFTTSYESYNDVRTQGYVSGPLNDKLRGRLSWFTEDGGAWQKNVNTGQKLGDKDMKYFRGQLEWDATDNLLVSLQAHYGRDQSEVNGVYSFYNSDQSHRDTGWNFDPTFAREAGFSTSRKPSKDNISKGLSLRADLDLGSTTFTSLTSADFFDRNELNDYGAGVTPHIAALWKGNDRVFSQDFRLSSNGKQRFNWTLGSYLAYTRIDTDWFTDTVSVNGTSVETSFLQTSKSAALYGQSDYLLTDRLKFISGLRLERENISLDDFTSTTVAAPSATYPLRDEDRALNKNLWSGKLGLEYTFADNLLGYASISRGVKSGGFGGKVATLETQLDPVKPEELIAYEVGFKADLTPTTRLNGAVFYYDYRNQQVSGLILPPTGRVVRKLENAERSHVYGGELEFQWRPFGGLAISQSLGYKTGRFDDYHTFNAQGQAVDLSGKRETFPKLSYGGSATYDWRVSDFKLQAEADYSYHDSQDAPLVPFGVAAADYSLDAYWLTNARLSLSPASDAWTVSLYSRNLFNTKYDTSRVAWSSVQTVAVAGAPRTVGVQLSVPF